MCKDGIPEMEVDAMREEYDDEIKELKQVIESFIRIEDCITGGNALMSNQGQEMDGFSALANFRDIAQKAKKLFEK